MKPAIEAYLRLLLWRPSRALAVAYWHLTGRKTRALLRLRAAVAGAPFVYAGLIRRDEAQAQRDLGLVKVASRADSPMLSIVATISGDEVCDWIVRLRGSLARQRYNNWELLLVGVGPTAVAHADDDRIRFIATPADEEACPIAAGLSHAQGKFVIPLAEGFIISDFALVRFAQAILDAPGVPIIYGDEDRIDRAGQRYTPWLKPDWNAEMILALDFVSGACALEVGAARIALRDRIFSESSTIYGLVLAMTQGGAETVTHIHHVLTHQTKASEPDSGPERLRAVAARLAQTGATVGHGPFGTTVVRWPMPTPPPSVTILVPTRDRVDLLQPCVDSLLAGTVYPDYAVVIIDNGSTDSATIDYFAQASRDPRVTILPCDMPYNFSAINNAAASQAAGEYLCFLNNDTQIIDGDWLSELMRYAVRPEIGAAGAQLLYEDGSIQHAGVVIGLVDGAGHAHRGLKLGEKGYFAHAYAPHFASAVTAACMVVKKCKFEAVGRFDAEHLGIAYNDVDLCLKLQAAGWRNIYAPQARLLHLETKSRGFDLAPMQIERYRREQLFLQKRWQTNSYQDPMHHPALDRTSEVYRITF